MSPTRTKLVAPFGTTCTALPVRSPGSPLAGPVIPAKIGSLRPPASRASHAGPPSPSESFGGARARERHCLPCPIGTLSTTTAPSGGQRAVIDRDGDLRAARRHDAAREIDAHVERSEPAAGRGGDMRLGGRGNGQRRENDHDQRATRQDAFDGERGGGRGGHGPELCPIARVRCARSHVPGEPRAWRTCATAILDCLAFLASGPRP